MILNKGVVLAKPGNNPSKQIGVFKLSVGNFLELLRIRHLIGRCNNYTKASS